MRADVAVCCCLLVLAVVMTWPLVIALDRAVIEPDDPYINTWILDWDWYGTITQPLSLFDAPLLFPAHLSLAFSENLYGIFLFLIPLHLIGLQPLTIHNVAILLGFWISGVGMYVAARVATSSRFAALAAATFYAFVPFRFTQLHHVQYVWACWPPLLMAALIWCRRKPAWNRAWLFGVAFLFNGLTNVYWLLYCAVASFASLFVLRPDRTMLTRIVAVTMAAGILLAPFLLPYIRASHTYHMHRTWDEIRESSANVRDWLNPGVLNRTYRPLADLSRNPECWLFAGFLGIVLAAAGAIAGRRVRYAHAVAIVWVVIGFLGSLGVNTPVFGVLFRFAPGFQALRVPSRFANVAYAGMGLLIALALHHLPKRYTLVAPLTAAMLIVELRAAPIQWYVTSPNVPATYVWLKSTSGPVAEWPTNRGESEYAYTRWAATHHRRTINGISGFEPPEFRRLSQLSEGTSLSPYIDELRKIGVRTLVMHGEFLSPPQRKELRELLLGKRLTFVARRDHQIEGDWIFDLQQSLQPYRRDENLERFLAGLYTYNEDTFGLLNDPAPEAHLRGGAIFSGWALSPYGVRKVDLLFDSGEVRVHTTLRAEPSLHKAFPWYDATTRPRFVMSFSARPRTIRRETNVQAEITDGRGNILLLEGRRLTWDD